MVMALIPLVIAAAKTYMDQQNAQSADKAQAAAGAEKLRIMREGAGQMSQYRQQLTPQMLQAMENQKGAYNGARSVLSQMYGGGGGSVAPPSTQRPPDPSRGGPTGSVRSLFSGTGPGDYGNLVRPAATSGTRPTAPTGSAGSIFSGIGLGDYGNLVQPGPPPATPPSAPSGSASSIFSGTGVGDYGNLVRPSVLRSIGFGGETPAPVRGRF